MGENEDVGPLCEARDRNGSLDCVRLLPERNGGAHCIFMYGGGRVAHYIPPRVMNKLEIELKAWKEKTAEKGRSGHA